MVTLPAGVNFHNFRCKVTLSSLYSPCFAQRQNSNIIRKNSQNAQNNNQTGSDADLSVTGKVVGTKSRSGIATRNSTQAKNNQPHRATTGTYKVSSFF